MKKKLKIFLIVLGILVLIVIFSLARRGITPIRYSNLSSKSSLELVTTTLEKSNVPQSSIDVFRSQVIFTNDYLSELPNLQGSFVTKKGTVVKYDDYLMFELFRKVKMSEDMNCRIAAWNLIKDKVTVTPISGHIEDSEEEILNYYPATGFVKGDKENFWGVFKGIPAAVINTTGGYGKAIQKEWKKRNVIFEDSPIKLISCYSYSFENKWLEAVHAGVSIKTASGIMFIEKWNPKAPFQVSLFKNKKQLKYYLKQRLIGAFIIQPIIMENENIL